MSLCPTPAFASVAESACAAPAPTVRPTLWSTAARSRRVILLVLGIWLFNAFDLVLTVLAHNQGLLREENPLARALLEMGIPSLVLFKIGLVLIGSYPLLRFRMARITEMGTCVILVAYMFLAVHWNECYNLYLLTATNNVHIAEISGAQIIPTPFSDQP